MNASFGVGIELNIIVSEFSKLSLQMVFQIRKSNADFWNTSLTCHTLQGNLLIGHCGNRIESLALVTREFGMRRASILSPRPRLPDLVKSPFTSRCQEWQEDEFTARIGIWGWVYFVR